MTVGVGEEHEALRDAVRAWARGADDAARAAVDGRDAGLPPAWADLARQGLLAVHVAEEHGGGGGGLVEAAVVVEELGRALIPGPVLPTVTVAAVLAAAGGAAPKELLPGLADGTLPAAMALGIAPAQSALSEDGSLRLHGIAAPVPGGAAARVLLLAVSTPRGRRWALVDLDGVTRRALPSLDVTTPCAAIELDGIAVPPERLLDVDEDLVEALAVTLAAAEAAGIASWCLDTAVEHARVREQFGRPIGQFQAVKHRCADMLVALEQARAVAWGAARAAGDAGRRPFAAAVAGAIALDAAVGCAKDCIQVLGGIGYTWEHGAHLRLRRATSLRQVHGGAAAWADRVATLALEGRRRPERLELPAYAEAGRAAVRDFLSGLPAGEPARRAALAEHGYLAPHWPAPWGRGAGPAEQLVIAEEFAAAGVDVPDLSMANWVVPTLIEHGAAAQCERFIPPTLRGELAWCQMFSEPGAGSDLASLRTRAVRAEGGWRLNGQKVWTSRADEADWAICLARTGSPESRHRGITYFLVDMRAPGVEVRPFRNMTGEARFSEVFLSDVFVPDDCVVGAVDQGWRLVHTTLANERVAMSDTAFGAGADGVLELLRAAEPGGAWLARAGGLLAEQRSLELLALRTALRRLAAVDPGPLAGVRKLLGMHHQQDTAEAGLELLGPAGATTGGAAASWTQEFLVSRCLTIGGGTSEILRNVIGERILGLPRDDAR